MYVHQQTKSIAFTRSILASPGAQFYGLPNDVNYLSAVLIDSWCSSSSRSHHRSAPRHPLINVINGGLETFYHKRSVINITTDRKTKRTLPALAYSHKPFSFRQHSNKRRVDCIYLAIYSFPVTKENKQKFNFLESLLRTTVPQACRSVKVCGCFWLA